jgi:hypothetical protein
MTGGASRNIGTTTTIEHMPWLPRATDRRSEMTGYQRAIVNLSYDWAEREFRSGDAGTPDAWAKAGHTVYTPGAMGNKIQWQDFIVADEDLPIFRSLCRLWDKDGVTTKGVAETWADATPAELYAAAARITRIPPADLIV